MGQEYSFKRFDVVDIDMTTAGRREIRTLGRSFVVIQFNNVALLTDVTIEIPSQNKEIASPVINIVGNRMFKSEVAPMGNFIITWTAQAGLNCQIVMSNFTEMVTVQ